MWFFPRTINKREKKLLLVKLDAIGDFILWLDAAKEFKRLFKEHKITLIGNQTWTSLAEKLPYFDTVWSVDRYMFEKNSLYRSRILSMVYQAAFDIAIQSTLSRELIFGDSIVRISRAKERIGSEGNHSNISLEHKMISDMWYTRLIPATDKPLMELERNAEFMRGIGLSDFLADIPKLQIPTILPAGFRLKDYYVIFPGAGSKARQWPVQNFKELSKRIYMATGWTGIICGGHGEKGLGKKLIEGNDILLQDWTGQTSLEELIAIISNASLIISNDTSAGHISAAVETPSVCILGGGHFGRFMPYKIEVKTDKPLPVAIFEKDECFDCNWECFKTTSKECAAPCILNVKVNKVWEAVKLIIFEGK
jgi:ADP-heptose:LPS heptosyltransferase